LVRISFVATTGRVLPRFGGAPSSLASIDATLAGSDDRSQSRRVALVAFATRVVSAVIVLASQVMMARWMGEHEYGVFVVVWVAAVIVGGLSCFGFQLSVVRFIPEYLERKKDGLLRGIILGARAYGLATSTILALIGALGLALLGDRIASYYVMPFYRAAICLPMLAIGEIQEGVARAFNWGARCGRYILAGDHPHHVARHRVRTAGRRGHRDGCDDRGHLCRHRLPGAGAPPPA
jgi:hypothetical protein